MSAVAPNNNGLAVGQARQDRSALQAIRPQLRRDLYHRILRHGDATHAVIKDPVSSEFYTFTYREYALLSLFDGRSMEDVVSHWNTKYPAEQITLSEAVVFVTDLARQGLMLSPRLKSELTQDAGTAGLRALITSRQQILSVLFLRWRGIDPSRFLEAVYPVVRPLFQAPTLLAIACLICIAAGALLLHQEILVDALTTSAHWLSPSGWLQFALLFVFVKVVHECSHALTAWHFGHRCSEMGIVFCLGVPCLYCDISEVWFEPVRWKRMMTSAAGILAELVIAAIAAIMWVTSYPGAFHEICFQLMLLCSIQTIVINGNPLLRYDGYYLLTDWIRLPNLRTRADQWMSRWWEGWILNGRWTWPHEAESSSLWLLVYALSSRLYRLGLWFVVLYSLLKLFERYEMKGTGTCVVGLIGLGLIQPTAFSMLRISNTWLQLFREGGSIRRRVTPPLVLLFIFSFVVFFPLPRSVRVTYFVEPDSEQILHAPYAGRVMKVLESNQEISKGQLVFVIDNRELKHRIERNQIELDNAIARLEHAERLRGENTTWNDRIPALKSSIHTLKSLAQKLKDEASRCQVYAELDGTLILPRSGQPSDVRKINNSVAPRSFSRIESLDSFATEGMWMGSIVGNRPPRFVLYVSEREVELIQPGQYADIALIGFKPNRVTGLIEQIDIMPTESVPPEVIAQNEVQTEFVRSGQRSVIPYYRVNVSVENDVTRKVPFRYAGQSLVKLPNQSLWSRGRDWLSQTF